MIPHHAQSGVVMWSEVNKKREFCILGTRFFMGRSDQKNPFCPCTLLGFDKTFHNVYAQVVMFYQMSFCSSFIITCLARKSRLFMGRSDQKNRFFDRGCPCTLLGFDKTFHEVYAQVVMFSQMSFCSSFIITCIARKIRFFMGRFDQKNPFSNAQDVMFAQMPFLVSESNGIQQNYIPS